jgi:hypothetical protein
MKLSKALALVVQEDVLTGELNNAPWARAIRMLEAVKDGIDVPGVESWFAATNDLRVSRRGEGGREIEVSLVADMDGRITILRGSVYEPVAGYDVISAWSIEDAMKGLARLLRQVTN